MMRSPHSSRGFTLIEAVMVIVITGVLSAIVAVFIKKPVEGYFDSARRAALTDVADTAIRRMARDIHKALPNSVRQANNQCIEFIPTKTGGRYRAEVDATGSGDILNFTSADTSFDMFGLNSALPADQQIATGDVIAIYNLGITGADAYNADNTSAVSASPSAGALANETTIPIASKQFPMASGSNRFHVIPANEKIVSFVCSGGKLYRNSNYAYSSSCPTTGGAVLANNVASCTFVYNGSDLQRNALVQMTLNLSSSGETVSLYHEVHVSNTP
jgi:MSHA biogenesis protein MshO